jgi:hypothetical protein
MNWLVGRDVQETRFALPTQSASYTLKSTDGNCATLHECQSRQLHQGSHRYGLHKMRSGAGRQKRKGISDMHGSISSMRFLGADLRKPLVLRSNAKNTAPPLAGQVICYLDANIRSVR